MICSAVGPVLQKLLLTLSIQFLCWENQLPRKCPSDPSKSKLNLIVSFLFGGFVTSVHLCRETFQTYLFSLEVKCTRTCHGKNRLLVWIDIVNRPSNIAQEVVGTNLVHSIIWSRQVLQQHFNKFVIVLSRYTERHLISEILITEKSAIIQSGNLS